MSPESEIVKLPTADAAGSWVGIVSKSPSPTLERAQKRLSACKAVPPLVERRRSLQRPIMEVALRRRQFLLTALASAFVASAATQEKAQEKAEEQKGDADLDPGPIKGTEVF
jgi:hypothetical protein